MEKKTIVWDNEKFEVEAEVFGPVMIHEHPEMPAWMVSHTATGTNIAMPILPSKEAAQACCLAILADLEIRVVLEGETIEECRKRVTPEIKERVEEIADRMRAKFADEIEAMIPPTPTMETLIEQIELDADELEHISNDPDTKWLMDRICIMIEEASDEDQNKILGNAMSVDAVVSNHSHSYAEPGYDDPEGGCIFVGNWNKHDNLVRIIEAAGGAVEWEDEWSTCSDCYKLVRTQGDGHGWTASFVIQNECELFCHECMEDEDDRLEHLKEELEGNPEKGETLGWDLEELGYVEMDEDFQNGLYGGQKDDPHAIGKALESRDITRYVFQIDRVGQFDCHFSCWIHESELTDFQREYGVAFEEGETHAAIDPAVAMKQALRSASEQMNRMKDDGGVKFATCHEDGTATVKSVSKEDFIAGNM